MNLAAAAFSLLLWPRGWIGIGQAMHNIQKAWDGGENAPYPSSFLAYLISLPRDWCPYCGGAR